METSARAKACIVAEDEREESGRRALLNLAVFGHALGGLRRLFRPAPAWQAIAIGMRLAFDYSAERVDFALAGDASGRPTFASVACLRQPAQIPGPGVPRRTRCCG